jgi:dolichol-phosphate mannosyltransferase
MTELALVVPVHNEIGNIEPFFERTRTVLESLAVSWKIVFVNDGSSDGSLERMLALHEQDDRVKIISLSRNFGYHSVLYAGLSLVEADRYAMIDVDCEDPPELLRDFHAAIEHGADIAYGIRSNREEPAPVTFFRRIFYYLNRSIADSEIVVWMSEFAMITRQVRDIVLVPKTTYLFLRAEIAYAGFSRIGIAYRRAARTSGKTHYNVWNMSRFAVSGFLAGSTFPLRLILYIAVVVAILFPLVAILGGLGVAGATALASMATLYFALFALSLMAMYLARTYKNGVARPLFIVDRGKTYL